MHATHDGRRYMRANDGGDGVTTNRIPDLLSGRAGERKGGMSVAGKGALEVVDGWPDYGSDAWEAEKHQLVPPALSEEAQTQARQAQELQEAAEREQGN